MKTSPITKARIDELLRFLPAFSSKGQSLNPTWRGGEQDDSGVWTMPWPSYPETVREFFRLAAKPCWNDYNYNPSDAGEMVGDDATIAGATLAQIKTMLTYCVRGERFCDGHWQEMFETGRILALLRRLQALRDEGRVPRGR